MTHAARALSPCAANAPPISGTMNCSSIIPIDHVPARSPQAVHTALLPRIAGNDVIEIGARHGDDAACFVNVTKSLKIFEIERKYCDALSERLQKIPGAKYAVLCHDYRHTVSLKADVVLWWQHAPHLVNEKVLNDLSVMGSRKNALAISLHDNKWKQDVDSFYRLRPHALWSDTISFDERAFCCKRHGKPANCAENSRHAIADNRITCDRAYGSYNLLAFNISALALRRPYL